MTENQNTPYSTKCQILADFWMTYRYDEDFAYFMEYADLGLPLAYAIANDVVKSTDEAKRFIEDTFAMLLTNLNIEQDTGFVDMNNMFDNSSEDPEEE